MRQFQLRSIFIRTAIDGSDRVTKADRHGQSFDQLSAFVQSARFGRSKHPPREADCRACKAIRVSCTALSPRYAGSPLKSVSSVGGVLSTNCQSIDCHTWLGSQPGTLLCAPATVSTTFTDHQPLCLAVLSSLLPCVSAACHRLSWPSTVSPSASPDGHGHHCP